MLRLWSIAKVRFPKAPISDSNFWTDLFFNGVSRRRFTSKGGGRTVMSFGDGSHGALGLSTSIPGMGIDAYEPTIVPSLSSDISLISAGHYHSLAVTSSGEIWAWGRNNEGQLGRSSTYTARYSMSEPKRVEGLDNVTVRAAFASGVISAAIGNDGSLWVWGRSKRGQLGLGKGIIEALVPSRVETLADEHVVKVSFGWGHALALTIDGKVFGWGYAADGRIGNVGFPLEASLLDAHTNESRNDHHVADLNLEEAEKHVVEAMKKENNMPIAWKPHLVEELHNIKVADIACGSDHSLILCHDGTLLSSGSNIYGQLGRCQSKQDLGMTPVDITGSPISIAAGLGHSLAICNINSSNGGETRILSWGWNISQQLGRGNSEKLPRMVEDLDEETPTSVSAGRVHSLCVTDKGEVWVWGCGKNGRLGLGSSSDEPEPIMLENVEGCVLQAVTGFDHSLILVAD